MEHFYLGAMNKKTNLYEFPSFAIKNNDYSCPECKREVILKKGKINVHHFCHKTSNEPCKHYKNPNTSTIHSIAQNQIIEFLNKKQKIKFIQKCIFCHHENKFLINLRDNCEVKKEFRFEDNGKLYIYDIAILKNNKVCFIIEIYNKHKTKEINRYNQKWVEINAKKTLKKINNNIFIFDCVREYMCDNEFCKMKYEEERNLHIKNHNNPENIENKMRYNIIKKQYKEMKKINNYYNFIRESIHKFSLLLEEQNNKRNSINLNYINCVNCIIKNINLIVPNNKKINTVINYDRLLLIVQNNEKNNREKILNDEEEEINDIYKKIKYIKEKNITHCKCDLEFKNLCKCDNPNFFIHGPTQNLSCEKCKLWKCRCL